jgi:3-hydroxyisobutyrate dehydrogenase-like beta-hydroxyacid dehydrogenase
MGASIAAVCDGETVWCSAGRSSATRQRAADAGMTEVGSVEEMIERVDLIVSICPPGAAMETAEAVADAGFGGIYADLNAVAPGTARRLGERFEHFVDGGIVGQPVKTPGTTRLYLSGSDAKVVACRWTTPALDVRGIDGGVGAASAVKSCFAAWTKGSAALLLTVRALARAEGVEDPLLSEWATSIPDLEQRSEHAATGNGPKASRFVGEMLEISTSLADVGLPAGFGTAAAEVYERLAGLRNDPHSEIATVIESPPPPAPRLTQDPLYSPERWARGQEHSALGPQPQRLTTAEMPFGTRRVPTSSVVRSRSSVPIGFRSPADSHR